MRIDRVNLNNIPMKIFLLLVIGAGLFLAGCATPPSKTVQAPQVTASASADLLIISATYGSGVSFADVTYRVNDLLRQPGVRFFARPEWLGADPTPGWNKALVIVYERKGQRHTFATGEGGAVSAALLQAQK
jgi:hypothetical protein